MAPRTLHHRGARTAATLLAVGGAVWGVEATCRCFAALSQPQPSQRLRSGRAGSSRVALEAYEEMSAISGLSGFQGSQLSLWTTFGLFVVALPGVYSTIERTGQAKFVEKTYVMPGTAVGGLEMRSIAAGVVAYFTGLNYAIDDGKGKQNGRIRFVGNMKGSMSQALYLVSCVLGAAIATGFVLQSLFPDGPFGLDVNFWYSPAILSPYVGWYYWERAFRKDIVEIQLALTDDQTSMTLSALGDKETIEALQAGVRFQSTEGKLFQLMERGTEYQPGIFEGTEEVQTFQEQPKAEKVPTAA
eukprot:CAMPEP_0115080238 /NCGR_PEP_ID=MMETSP0227-20121206/18563_1 /TAXON_ID=89957 /ORGANISM="Polarella glacialis, Strain CCMP 1383" /LENGTH=300 /DNA_ID=CAMNT_0002467851 /DNA_START=68 /DNA_END=970 /DNA_ORIENTATION=-